MSRVSADSLLYIAGSDYLFGSLCGLDGDGERPAGS